MVPWSPGRKASATSARAQQAPIGHAVAQGLGHGDDVGPDAVVLEPEPPPGAAEPGLDLVHDQQHVALVAQPADVGQVPGGRHVDPALALDALEQDGGDRRVDGRGQGVEVAQGDVAEARGQGLEGLVLLGLAGGVEGGQGAPVERAVGADHRVAARTAPAAGQLEGALVGLGAGVAEEDLAPPPPSISRSRVAATSGPSVVP